MRRNLENLLMSLLTKIKNYFTCRGYWLWDFDDFRKNHPKRFFNLGICEQSIIGVASGMALDGLKPWVYTITPF